MALKNSGLTPSFSKTASRVINLPPSSPSRSADRQQEHKDGQEEKSVEGRVTQREKNQANDIDVCAEVKNEAIKPLHKLPNASAAIHCSSKRGINKRKRSRLQAEGS